MGFPCRCCHKCKKTCNHIFDETVEYHLDGSAYGVSAPTIEADPDLLTTKIVWDLPENPQVLSTTCVVSIVKINQIPPDGWTAANWSMKLQFLPTHTTINHYYDPIDIRGALMFKKDGKFYIPQNLTNIVVNSKNTNLSAGTNGNLDASYWQEIDINSDFWIDFTYSTNTSSPNLAAIDYQANGGIHGVVDAEPYFCFITQVNFSGYSGWVYPDKLEIKVIEFCITYLNGSLQQKCRPRIEQRTGNNVSNFLRGPQIDSVGIGGSEENGFNYTIIRFMRNYGVGICNRYLFLFFEFEDEDGFRFFRSEPYLNRNDETCFMFARVWRCSQFCNCWISTDSEAFEMPESCSDSSNYLPIWDNGIGVEDTFDPDNPVNPIYIFGDTTSLIGGSGFNWAARMFGLNFPKSFYRYTEKIEVRNFQNFLPQGTLDVDKKATFGSCGTDVGDGWINIGEIDVSIGNRPGGNSAPQPTDHFFGTPSSYMSIQRPYGCQKTEGGVLVPQLTGGQWMLGTTYQGGYSAFDCSANIEFYLFWINKFSPGVTGVDQGDIHFFVTLWAGNHLTIGELTGDLGEEWTTFSNLEPITKSGSFGGGFSQAYRAFINDLVLGEFEARMIFKEEW